jgi:hypothetical protein
MMTQSAVDDNFFFIIAYSSLFLSARDLLPVEDKRGVTREKVSPGNTGRPRLQRRLLFGGANRWTFGKEEC